MIKVTIWWLAFLGTFGCGGSDTNDDGGNASCTPTLVSADSDKETVFTSDEECAASCACKEMGYCSFDRAAGGDCRPEKDADCQQSDACANDGRCSFLNSDGWATCLALEDDDCADSSVCQNEARCSSDGYECVQ
jgi:hypothetical protein